MIDHGLLIVLFSVVAGYVHFVDHECTNWPAGGVTGADVTKALDECRNDCDGLESCAGFGYTPQTSKCQLFTADCISNLRYDASLSPLQFVYSKDTCDDNDIARASTAIQFSETSDELGRYWVHVQKISTTKALIVYRSKKDTKKLRSRVVTISGDATPSLGPLSSESAFVAGDDNVAALTLNERYVLFSVSGSAKHFDTQSGTPSELQDIFYGGGGVNAVNLGLLDSDKVLLTYTAHNDCGGFWYACARVLTLQPDKTWSKGDAQTLQSKYCDWFTINLPLSATKAVIGIRSTDGWTDGVDTGKGGLVTIATISGDTVTPGTWVTWSKNPRWGTASLVSSGTVLFIWREDGSPNIDYTCTGVIDGDTMSINSQIDSWSDSLSQKQIVYEPGFLEENTAIIVDENIVSSATHYKWLTVNQATVSGSSVSFGTPQRIAHKGMGAYSSTAMDAGTFVIAYCNDGHTAGVVSVVQLCVETTTTTTTTATTTTTVTAIIGVTTATTSAAGNSTAGGSDATVAPTAPTDASAFILLAVCLVAVFIGFAVAAYVMWVRFIRGNQKKDDRREIANPTQVGASQGGAEIQVELLDPTVWDSKATQASSLARSEEQKQSSDAEDEKLRGEPNIAIGAPIPAIDWPTSSIERDDAKGPEASQVSPVLSASPKSRQPKKKARQQSNSDQKPMEKQQSIDQKKKKIGTPREQPKMAPTKSNRRKQPAKDGGSAPSDVRGSESLLLGIQLKWTLEVFPRDVQKHVDPSRVAEELSFHEIAPIKAYGGMSYGKGKLCPRDGRMDCSIVDAVFELGQSRRATLFLSWAWSYKLGVVLNALREFSDSHGTYTFTAETCFLWWCFFQNNQHRMLGEDRRLTTDELANVFGSRLQEVGTLVCLMDRIEESQYTQRIWCVFEVFIAERDAIPIEIILPSSCQGELNSLVKEGGFTRLKDAIEIDVGKAKASCSEDEENIKDLIKTSSSFQSVNQAVRESLLRCIQGQITKALR